MNTRPRFPSFASRKQKEVMQRLLAKTGCDPESALAQAKEHLERARQEAKEHPLINVALAEAIVSVFDKLTVYWDCVPDQVRPWLLAAMCYFVSADDEEPDFQSYIGFEDDVQVLNACLNFAELHELAIDPEDFDGY